MTSATRGVGSRVRGLLAAIFTLIILAGIPLALIALGADPIPDQVPAWNDVTRVLSRPSTDATWLFTLLIAVAWGAWAIFAVSFAVELTATVRGTAVKAVHSLSPRSAARGLIAAIALLATPVAPVTAFALQPEVVVTQSAVPASPTVQMTQANEASPTVSSARENQSSPTPRTQSYTRYEVERGDTLWDIADEELNDGHRFDEIYEASRSKLQPGGKRLSDPNHIETGWQLRIPAEHSDSDTSIRTPKRQAAPRDVAPPDSSASPGTDSTTRETAPGGDQALPQNEQAAPPKEQAQPQNEQGVPLAGSSSPSGTSEPSETKASAPSVPTKSVAPQATKAAPIPTPSDATQGSSRDSDQSRAPSAQFQTYDDDALWGLRTATGVGALLAAGLGASLATRRMIQRRNRRPGQLIPLLPPEEAIPEGELARIADPLSMGRVDTALRALSRDCTAAGEPLPVVRQARLSEHQFELFLAEPARLPSPWIGTSDGAVWTLDAETIQDEGAADVPAPYPALVTIGHITTRGHEAHLLLDLDYVAALGVIGGESEVAEIIRALSLELATSVWADDLQVTAIGALAELDDALKSGRVHHVSSPQPTLDHVDRRCTADSEALAGAELDLRAARATARLPEVWSPEVLVATQPLTSEDRQQLGACIARQPRATISAITAHDVLGDWFLELDPDDPSVAILQPLGCRLEPQRVSEDVYQAILDTFTRADQSPASTGGEAAATPEPSLASLPCDPQPTTAGEAGSLDFTHAVEAHGTGGESGDRAPSPAGSPEWPSTPMVRILGAPELAGATGPIEESKRARCLEIAAYLALNPNEPPETMNAALWPGDPSGEYSSVRSGLLSRTRRWLGTDDSGEYWLQYADGGECSMRPEVTTDWAVLNELLPDGPFTATEDQLVAAVRLIRGKPFQQVSTRRYGWAAVSVQKMVPLLTDISYELSTRLLTSGHWAGAVSVASVGLEVDELYEPLWRIRFMATSRSEGPKAALDQIQQLERALDHYGLDLEQETLDLMESIEDPVAPAGTG